MKFSINRLLLLNNLNHVTKALSTRPQMPILSGIKVEVKKEEIVLTATNTTISIQAKINDKNRFSVEKEGIVVLPGKYLYDIIRKVDTEIIDFINFETNEVKILADRSNFTLNVLEKETFPLLNFDVNNHKIVLDTLNIKQIIKKTTFAASLSESREVLTGVLFEVKDNEIHTIATDSFRLAKKQMNFENKMENVRAIIPSKSLEELNKIVEDIEEDVEIHFTNTKALFIYKNILFQTRLVDGIFPNTEALIPTSFLTEITFNKQEMVSTLERASLFTSGESTNIIKLSITDEGNVQIASTQNEIGAVSEVVVPKNITNLVPFQIAFSSKFFSEALKAFDSPEVTVHFTGEIKPFIVTGEYDINHLQLILPVRVA